MNATHKTNVEKINEFMNFGSPLNQAFVIEACRRYSEQIVSDEMATLKAMQSSFISGPAWIQCAKEYLKQNPA